MTQFNEEQYDKAFADIVATASAAPEEGEVLAVHMWEWSYDRSNLIFDKAIHDQEIQSVLAVMANEKGAVYDDSQYGWSSRYQTCDGENGLLVLACTSLQLGAPCKLYDASVSGTGLLLSGATPAFASASGIGSFYKENEDSNLHYNGGKNFVGDPKSKSIQDKAIKQLMSLKNGFEELFETAKTILGYNEVCLNTKMEHVSGILVDGVKSWVDDAYEFIDNDADQYHWRAYLSGHPELATRIRRAFDEYDMVVAKFEEKGMTPSPVPTVVIYQPEAQKVEDRMLHFPPIEKNRAIVNAIPSPVSQHFMLSSTGAGFDR